MERDNRANNAFGRLKSIVVEVLRRERRYLERSLIRSTVLLVVAASLVIGHLIWLDRRVRTGSLERAKMIEAEYRKLAEAGVLPKPVDGVNSIRVVLPALIRVKTVEGEYVMKALDPWLTHEDHWEFKPQYRVEANGSIQQFPR